MPSDVFNNLPKEKKERVLEVLRDTFQAKPFQKVTVKEIVEELDIARGSFYQYFENLEDAYFTILDQELIDIHLLFLKIFKEENEDMQRTLEEYGRALSEILFEAETYYIYANCYLYWDEHLRQGWSKIKKDQLLLFEDQDMDLVDMEEMQFVRAVVHGLIERNYREKWTKEEFLRIYRRHMKWIQEGVK